MKETRAEAMHRLQREGRWEEASAYRDRVRKGLRSRGVARREAGETAWQSMMEKFPPLDPERQPGKPWEPNQEPAAGPDPALAALRERTAGQPVDLVGDVFWVYQRMSDPGTVPDDAPGLGAWTLLEWARKYQRAFFDKLLPKAQAVREKAGEASDDELYRREMKTIRELKEMLRPYMEDLEVKCPNCGFSLDAETWQKHLEARKVTEQRPKQRWGEDG